MRLNANHIDNMLSLLEEGSSNVEINRFTFVNSGSHRRPYLTIKYDDEPILRRDFETITSQDVLDVLKLPSKFTQPKVDVSEKTGWEYVEKSEYLREWRTQIDNHSVYIESEGNRAQKNYTVHAPVEDASEWQTSYGSMNKDVANSGKSFEELDSAIMYTLAYLNTYTPHEVDKYVRMDAVAKEKFQDITGVGEKTVEEIVEDKHIRTYEGLKGNIRVLSRNYVEDAKDELTEKINNGQKIEKDPSVQTINAKIVSENV